MNHATYRHFLLGLFAAGIATCTDTVASGSSDADSGIWNGVLERALVAGVAFIFLIPIAAALAASKNRAHKAAQPEIDDSDQGVRARVHDRSTRSMKWGVASIAIVVLLMVGGFTIWPTIYRYDSVALGSNLFPVRTHRITGEAEMLTPDGWKAQGVREQVNTVQLPTAELAKLDGNASFDGNSFSCTIYNGSAYRINEVVVTLIIREPDPFAGIGSIVERPHNLTAAPAPPDGFEIIILHRDYRLKNDYYTDPLETGVLREYVGLQPNADQKWTWQIKSAKGVLR